MLALVAPAVRAPATGAVAPCAGVVVVVDFGHWGGAVEQHCVSNPASGLDALHEAGFTTSGTLKQGPAFVCRIDGLPNPADDACVVDPPITAYWAYYWARPGDASWHYADAGAAGRTPPAGTIDAWAFGNSAIPRISPAAFPRPEPPTTQAPKPAPSGPLARPGAAPSAGVAGAPAGSHAIAPTTTTPASARVTHAPTVTPSTTVGRAVGTTPVPRSTTTTTSVRVIDRAAASVHRSESHGSPGPLLLALLLVAAIGAGTFFVIRMRQRPA
jgi:hypothetical protein